MGINVHSLLIYVHTRISGYGFPAEVPMNSETAPKSTRTPSELTPMTGDTYLDTGERVHSKRYVHLLQILEAFTQHARIHAT